MSDSTGEDGERHTVFVNLKLSDDGFGTSDEADTIMDLGDEIGDFLRRYGIGEFDGDEFGMGFATLSLYFYGASADAVHAAILPFIAAYKPVSGSYLIVRYGGPDATQIRIHL